MMGSEARRHPDVRLVVGLGNPGGEYADTRHNIGFRVVDELARRWGMRFAKRQGKALVAEPLPPGARPVLVKPQTYMNLSGDSVRRLRQDKVLEPAQILVVYDDMDLPFGRIRLRTEGSAGGHGGMRSIIERLGTQAFPRLRVGVGRHAGDAVEHVLGRFSPEETEKLLQVVAHAADAIECVLVEGIEAAMNRFNARPSVLT